MFNSRVVVLDCTGGYRVEARRPSAAKVKDCTSTCTRPLQKHRRDAKCSGTRRPSTFLPAPGERRTRHRGCGPGPAPASRPPGPVDVTITPEPTFIDLRRMCVSCRALWGIQGRRANAKLTTLRRRGRMWQLCLRRR